MTRVSDTTELTIPLRNLIGIMVGLILAVWSYFGIIERLNTLEHDTDKSAMFIEMNNEFRIKWPRGELGALPADAKQDLMIEFLQKRVLKLEEKVEELENVSN
jgi:hypothetical protein